MTAMKTWSLVAAYGRAAYEVVAFPARCVDKGPREESYLFGS
jgi:hypothetical protein